METYHLYLLKEGLVACADGCFLSRNPAVASPSGVASAAESNSSKIIPFLSQHPVEERVTRAWPCLPNEGDLWWIVGVPKLPVGPSRLLQANITPQLLSLPIWLPFPHNTRCWSQDLCIKHCTQQILHTTFSILISMYGLCICVGFKGSPSRL